MKKLVEVYANSVINKSYTLREIYINPEYVVSLIPDSHTGALLREGRLPQGLDLNQKFTRVTVHKGSSGTEMVIVGDIATVREKLFTGKSLLKG